MLRIPATISKITTMADGGLKFYKNGRNGRLGSHHSIETKQKIGKANLGHKHSDSVRKIIKEKRKFQIFTEETRIKISQSKKGKKPYEMTDEIRQKLRDSQIKNPTRYWLGKRRLFGEKHWNWKGGISSSKRNPFWRNTIFRRDNYTCRICGKTNCVLNAHHLFSFAGYPKLRTEIKNGVTLCKPCHYWAHKICDNSGKEKND